ncbi:MFS general substrate transporter [Ascobolus immersus RN42]|uniref:MFS general substrate transporter n=1 Tax=Ascobolus immersus RN42 TaxID=1160509 RepID=A0A3N4IG22_ASCIM|nr:MFS general substrate transporter [Ascobolus immersus RN42]
MYERKALVIDREVDKMGMGKYQWYIWGLCGLGYFLDLLWAQAFGLIATPLQQELGFNTDQLGNIFTAFSSGLCAGAFVWGVLVDIIGRRAAFNGTVLITCIFGLCLGAPDTYNAILVLTAFNGFGIGGNIPIDTTICLEFLPKDRRFLLAMLSIFQPLGVVVCSGIAYGFVPKFNCLNNVDVPACSGSSLSPPDCLPSCFNVPKGEACCSKGDNMGWRYLTYCLGGISLFVFVLRFFLFTFQESPKFLLSKGKDEEAIKVIQHVAKVNGQETSLTMATFNALENSFGTRGAAVELPGGVILTKKHWTEKVKFELMRMKILFSSAMLIRLTLLVWVIYAFDYWGFSIAGSFLPTILLKKNSAINVSISETYRDYIIIYLPGIVGVALGALMVKVNRVGRKWAMVISSALMATSLFLFAAVNTQASNVGLNVMEYFFQSMFNAVLYGWTPEAFPAPVRGTASGIASFWGRLFSIWAPLVAARILDDNLNGPLYMAGAGVFVCTIAVMFLPSKAFDLNALMGK